MSSATPAPGPQRVAWARQKAAAESRRRAVTFREERKASTAIPKTHASQDAPAPASGPQSVARARQEAAAKGRKCAATFKKKGKTTAASPPAPVQPAAAAPASGPQRVAWARQEAADQERKRVALWRQRNDARLSKHMPRTVSEATVPLPGTQPPTNTARAPLYADVATEVTPHATVPQDASAPPAASAGKTTSAEHTHSLKQEIVVIQESAPVTDDRDSSQSASGQASVEGDDETLTDSWDDECWDECCWDEAWWEDDEIWDLNERKFNLKCPIYHVIFYNCDHCLSIMTKEEREWCWDELREITQERKALRQKRVKEFNAEIKKAEKRQRRKAERRKAKGKKPLPETPPRTRKIRFDLSDVPKPVKDREFLYKDYELGGVGMRRQWSKRLRELGGDEAAWREELEALAAGRGWRGEGLDHTDRRIEG